MNLFSRAAAPAALAFALLVAGAGLAQAQAVLIERPMPAPIVETAPPPPRAGVSWVRGHWVWRGSQWFWVAGHYVEGVVPPCRRKSSRCSLRVPRPSMFGCAAIGVGAKTIVGIGARASGSDPECSD